MSASKFYVGTRKGMFTFEKGATGWQQVGANFLGAQVPMLLNDPRSGLLHCSVRHEHFGTKQHRSSDGGKTWQEVDPPSYPTKPEGALTILDPWRQEEVPWSLKMIWSLEAGGAEQNGVLWCGTIPGGLFRSNDDGDTWELVNSLWDREERSKWCGGGYDFPGIHSICVHPNHCDDVSVAISCGGVWRTKDGGETWSQTASGMAFDHIPDAQGGDDPAAQDPHRMVQCRSNPDRFWIQHHCAIYRSDDSARSWNEIKEVTPSSFGFAVAVHPSDPDKAWFVPAKADDDRYPADGKFVVTRTRDGGKSFQVFDKGLPEKEAYDLVFRHGLDIDESGSVLVMGSTTGSLWVSEDQGESWDHITAHLPPVFCVRF